MMQPNTTLIASFNFENHEGPAIIKYAAPGMDDSNTKWLDVIG